MHEKSVFSPPDTKSYHGVAVRQDNLPPATDSNDTFLWFKGHWSKDGKNTFILVSPGNHDKKSNLERKVVITPGGDLIIDNKNIQDWNQRILEGTKYLNEEKAKLLTSANSSDEWSGEFSKVQLSQLRQTEEDWKNRAINTPVNIFEKVANKTAVDNSKANTGSWCDPMKSKYEALINFYKAHQNESEKDYQNPPRRSLIIDALHVTASDERNLKLNCVSTPKYSWSPSVA